jgi:hypothetical protein
MFPAAGGLVTPVTTAAGRRGPSLGGMGVRVDCRHYSTRTVGGGDVVQRCRVDMAELAPFACPEDCLFFEPRSITDAGWNRTTPPPAT